MALLVLHPAVPALLAFMELIVPQTKLRTFVILPFAIMEGATEALENVIVSLTTMTRLALLNYGVIAIFAKMGPLAITR
jgi:hypothetical protein